MQGQTVYHPRYGRGVATVRRKSGVEYQVRFESGDNRWVRADELELEATVVTQQPEAEFRHEQSVHFVERKIVEALRLGIVPDEGFELFTVGREDEVRDFSRWLESADEPAKTLIGAYGSGKTHLLNFIRLLALEAGYAVSLIEMDSQESPFSKPKRVYSQIARNLQWKDGGRIRDFRALLDRILQQGYLPDHRYYKYLRRRMEPELWSWIDGSDGTIRPMSHDGEFSHLPGLYDYTTAANVYCYLLSGLGWACQRRGVELRGILILFDESEAIYHARGRLLQERSVNFLDALICTAYDDEDLLVPASETDFEFAWFARQVPFLYKRPSGLKLLFAFTSQDDLDLSYELEELPWVELNPLGTDDFHGILGKLADVYNTAYKGHIGQADLAAAIEMLQNRDFFSTRAVVKSYIEALDISRFGTYSEEDDW